MAASSSAKCANAANTSRMSFTRSMSLAVCPRRIFTTPARARRCWGRCACAPNGLVSARRQRGGANLSRRSSAALGLLGSPGSGRHLALCSHTPRSLAALPQKPAGSGAPVKTLWFSKHRASVPIAMTCARVSCPFACSPCPRDWSRKAHLHQTKAARCAPDRMYAAAPATMSACRAGRRGAALSGAPAGWRRSGRRPGRAGAPGTPGSAERGRARRPPARPGSAPRRARAPVS